MLTDFTAQFQLWSALVSVSIFCAVVYMTRAKRRRVAGALIATLIFTASNVIWDVVARWAGWWSYPSQARWLLPLPVYFAQALVWGGAFGLLGWRVERRFGQRGLALYALLLSAIGGLRDFAWASNTKTILFENGSAPRFADVACWATLLVIAQVTLRLVGGPPTHDRLARGA